MYMKKTKWQKTVLFIIYLKGTWTLVGTILSNKAGITLTGNWVLPSEGKLGTIQNTNTGVNGYLTTNGNTAAGSAVVEEALHDYVEWKRSYDVSGYFTLSHHYGKFLTGHSSGIPNSLTIEGNAYCFCIFDHKLHREVLKVYMLLRSLPFNFFGCKAAKNTLENLLAELVVRIQMQFGLFFHVVHFTYCR